MVRCPHRTTRKRAEKTVAEELEFTRIDSALVQRAADLMKLAGDRKLSLVTAESCTGGLVAAVLSEAPGAGEWLHGGFVTYSKENKTAALGVPAALIERAGLVSEAVARAMAEGALARSPADIAVAITGVAGPATDEDGTPVGTVHFAAARRSGTTVHVKRQYGDVGRGPCRYAAIEQAFDLLRQAADLA
jgi:nicotinamide-nucleotide amidase